MEAPLTIGAQESGLARAQAEHLVRLLGERRARFPVHLEIFDWKAEPSDALHDDHIAESRSHIRALHKQLRAGEIDLVIHRGFDLRGQLAEDLEIAAILPRSSPYDALISPEGLTLDELEEGARVGVVQLRARAQLREHRPDLELELIVGDVGSWLTALIDGRIEALVAPTAALEQLGLHERVCEIFPPELLVPAPGSGVLLCVARGDDEENLERLASLHDAATAAEYEAELGFMEALGGPWEYPIGALAQCVGREMRLMGLVASADGSQMLRKGVQASAEDPLAVGRTLAELLLCDGADAVLTDVAAPCAPEVEELAGLLTAEADWDEDADEDEFEPEA